MPPRICPRLPSQPPPSSSSCSSSLRLGQPCVSYQPRKQSRRQFSSTPAPSTVLRDQLFAWLKGPGEAFRRHLPNSTNYLSAYSSEGVLIRATGKGGAQRRRKGSDDAEEADDDPEGLEDAEAKVDESNLPLEMRSEGHMPGRLAPETVEDLRPFPLNEDFRSQPVLSEELRQEIWKRIKVDKQSVRMVSVALGVEMRRVGAVVRLVELEREMMSQGKPLAKPYAKAVLAMLPTTPYNPGQRPVVHEPINDLPVHRLTQPQIFYPVSETRHFTRVDAGRVFSAAPRIIEPTKGDSFVQRTDHSILKPAEERIPHPQLVADEKEKLSNTSPSDRMVKYLQRMEQQEKAFVAERAKKAAREEKALKAVENGRFEFRFRDVTVSRETVGLDGRGSKGVGSRYGVPSRDRKRGTVRIPTSVDA